MVGIRSSPGLHQWKSGQWTSNFASVWGRLPVANVAVRSTESRDTMAVENNVYLAKLAEQAERYEGKLNTS